MSTKKTITRLEKIGTYLKELKELKNSFTVAARNLADHLEKVNNDEFFIDELAGSPNKLGLLVKEAEQIEDWLERVAGRVAVFGDDSEPDENLKQEEENDEP